MTCYTDSLIYIMIDLKILFFCELQNTEMFQNYIYIILMKTFHLKPQPHWLISAS